VWREDGSWIRALAPQTALREDRIDAAWVELEGVVVPLAELEAPLSGERCVLYQIALGLLQRLIDGGGATRETAGAWFLLRVRDGQLVLIDPAAALRVKLRRVLRRRCPLGRDAASDGRLRALYRRLARPAPRRAWIAGREARVVGGDRLRLHGWLSSHPDPRGVPASYREPPRLPFLRAEELRAVL
jgi:hypothetical protein